MNSTWCLFATLAVSQFLGGCAADGERVTEPRTVSALSRDAPASLRYVESQRMVRVISPEGMIPTVRDFDITYELADRDGQRTPLPFLDVRNADPLDVLNRVSWFPNDASWLGMSVRSTHHSEHVEKLLWKYVDDDFTTIRVVTFTRDRLLERHDLRVCNPGRLANPPIGVDMVSRVVRHCTPEGWATFRLVDGNARLTEGGSCCPSAAGQAMDTRTRQEKDFVVLVGR
jgi:hypothetical protein